MGVLTDDMARLRGEVNCLRDERMNLAKNIKETTQHRRDDTMKMREGFRNAHFDMAERSRQDRTKWFSGLKSHVLGMKEGFYSDFAVVRQNLSEMAMNTRNANSSFVTTLKDNVAVMKDGLRRAHAAMADKTQADRMAFLASLKANVSKMQDDFNKSRQEMSRSGKSARAAALSAIKADVSNLMENAHSELDTMHRLFSGMVAEARTNRSEFVDGLKKSVKSARMNFLDDLAGARVAWSVAPRETVHISLAGFREGTGAAGLPTIETPPATAEKVQRHGETSEEFPPHAEPVEQHAVKAEEDQRETDVQEVREMPESRSKEEKKASRRERNR